MNFSSPLSSPPASPHQPFAHVDDYAQQQNDELAAGYLTSLANRYNRREAMVPLVLTSSTTTTPSSSPQKDGAEKIATLKRKLTESQKAEHAMEGKYKAEKKARISFSTETNKKILEWNKEIKPLFQELNSAAVTINGLNKTVKTLKKRVENFTKEEKRLVDNNAQLTRDKKEMSALNSRQMNQQIFFLTQTVAATEKNSHLQQKSEKRKRQIAELGVENHHLQQKSEKRKKQLTEQAAEIERLKQHIASYQPQIGSSNYKTTQTTTSRIASYTTMNPHHP